MIADRLTFSAVKESLCGSFHLACLPQSSLAHEIFSGRCACKKYLDDKITDTIGVNYGSNIFGHVRMVAGKHGYIEKQA